MLACYLGHLTVVAGPGNIVTEEKMKINTALSGHPGQFSR